VAGLYLHPPANAVVLCIDEKSRIQALERTQPILPIVPEVPERQTHDYFRHGTTRLFAALDVLTGNGIGKCTARHSAAEYRAFLKKVDAGYPKKQVLHINTDNYATDKTQAVREHLEGKRWRFVAHCIPTHSSWLDHLERWFTEIANKRIRWESWPSVNELIRAIKEYIKQWNKSGRKFQRVKSAERISRRILLASIHAI
jgi:transposase